MREIRVLCVDDVAGAANDYADLITSKMGLGAVGASTPEDALQLLTRHPIAVAVLDQRMPQMTGTELYRLMLQESPRLKAIMLSGEAAASETAEALSILDYVRFVDKSQIDELIPAVQIALARAEAARAIEFEEVEVGRTGIHWIPWIPKSTFYLQSIELVRDAHVPQDCWRFIDEINAGEQKTITRKVASTRNFTSSIEIEGSSQFSLSTSLGVGKLAKITSGLNTRVASRLQTQNVSSHAFEHSETQAISLPEEPQDPSEQAVKTRTFYCGPEIMTLRLRIREHHIASNVDQIHWITVNHHTGYFVNRQVDVLTDGSKLERNTSRWP
jgi:CheY-like chemotaxis protein